MTEPTQDKETLREAVARIIAAELGDDFDAAFVDKAAWISARGYSGGRFRDVNEPFQRDYLDAADAAIATMFERLREADKETPSLTVDLIRQENYSGEHREWKEPITFPQNAEFYETVLEAVIATAFQQENSDA